MGNFAELRRIFAETLRIFCKELQRLPAICAGYFRRNVTNLFAELHKQFCEDTLQIIAGSSRTD